MNAIFLSASVPQPGRGDFHQSADPFLIQCAVRELLLTVLGRRLLVWGGHPAITPMVWSACEELDVSYGSAVVLYQSRFFEQAFPVENQYFNNVIRVDGVEADRTQSLLRMREAMFARPDLNAAVFIGGMEGVLEEYDLFNARHPNARVLAIAGPGGAARNLSVRLGQWQSGQAHDLNFTRQFHRDLGIAADEPRQRVLSI